MLLQQIGEFFRPLVKGMGFQFPRWNVPMKPLYAVAWVWEWLHAVLRIPPPPLACLELSKVATTHHFSIDKAKQEMGWHPKWHSERAIEESVNWYKDVIGGKAAWDVSRAQIRVFEDAAGD